MLLRHFLRFMLLAAPLVVVSCNGDSLTEPSVGSIEVTISTTGIELDPDGYNVSIDGEPGSELAVEGRVVLDGLEPGSHAVQITGTAANCAVAGDNPRNVAVEAGKVTAVVFSVLCSPTAGSLRVTSTTTGSTPDADGYTISLDGVDRAPLASNGEVILEGLASGDHLLGLGGLAGNCQVQGDNPRTVTVTPAQTFSVDFTIACIATAGTITVNVTSTGSQVDPDGYLLSIDGGGVVAVGRDAVQEFRSISAGAHSVQLSGLSPNCRTEGANPQTVTVTAGAIVTVAFVVECSDGVVHWSSIPLPGGFTGLDIWGSSANDLFVTGYDVSGVAAIWHYDGQQWLEQLRRPDALISGLWGSTGTDVFAVAPATAEPRIGAILHYDGLSWSETAVPSGGGNGGATAVWGNSAEDVFAGGLQFETGPYRVLLEHYDGERWTETPTGVGGANAGITDISGSSSTTVYALGENQICDGCDRARQFVARFDGSGWTESFVTDNELQGIWVGAVNDVWAAGSGPDGEGYLLHYNGAVWTETFRRTPQGNEPALKDVWGRSGTDIYAVGEGGILHFDGSNWTVVEPTPGLRVWGTSADVFALGQHAVLHGSR